MRIVTWALAALCAASVNAQTITTGEVIGTITDSSGALVRAAIVQLKSTQTGESRTAESNTTGAYRFSSVKPGFYEVSAAASALASDRGRLIVAVGQVQTVDLVLKIEEPRRVVLVTDSAPLLNADNANSIYTISTRQLELLPLPGGDLVAVAYSVPGVIVNNRYGNGDFATPGIGSMSNLFTVNGVDDMDPYWNVNNSGTSGMLLGANEIQEASIVQNAYEGQYGRQAGAQVNYISKSGSNGYHGSLVYNYNGALMNANDFFANRTGLPRPHAVSNQYAAALGGRIVRDRLFFFADTEGLRFAKPGTASVVAIPSPALQSYSLAAIQPSQALLYRQIFDLYNNAPGHERAVAVSNGQGSFQDRQGKLGCGALAGTPTGSGGIFGRDVACALAWGAYTPTQTSESLLTTRVDYNINAKQRVFFRFKTDHGFLPGMVSPISPLFNITSVEPDYEGQVNHTFVVTPWLVNNFIGSANYNDYVSSDPNLADALKLLPFRINISNAGANGAGGAFTPIGAPATYPSGRRAGQLQIVDDLSYQAGVHSIQAGVNYRYNRETDLSNSALAYIGRFNFAGLDEFANGVLNPASASNYSRTFSTTPVAHLRLYNLAFYVQDHWAATPHLNITATIRFDRTGNPESQDDCFARLMSPFADLNKNLSIPYNQSIQVGQKNAFYTVERVVPQPRLSAAYSPVWWKHTVLRGGIGIFPDLAAAFFAGRLTGNAPNVFSAVVHGGLVDTQGQGSAPGIAAASAGAFQRQFADGATLAQLQQAVAPVTFSPPFYYSTPTVVRSPKYLEWSFEMQHELGARNVFTARYAGNHGYDIFLFNPNSNSSASPASYPNGFGGLPATAPDPRFSGITQLTNNGYSNFNGLTAIFRRAFAHGFQGQISYTWSHALDTISSGGLGPIAGAGFAYNSLYGQIDPYGVRALNYSNADYDVRHNLTGEFTWEVPMKFQNRPVDAIFTGWAIAARVSTYTGTPFSVVNNGISSYGTVLADVLDPHMNRSCGRSAIDTACLEPGAFAPTAAQTNFGNVPRNSFRGPGYVGFDSSVYKSISVAERVRLTLGASAYNTLNHPNFGGPNANAASPSLGLITFTLPDPSSPYGWANGPSGRVLVVTGKLFF